MDLAEIKERWRLSGKAVSAVDPLFVDDAMNWLIAEVGRLQEEPSDLFYKLRDENQRLTALCDGHRGEVESLRETLAAYRDEETCMCSSPIKTHTMGDGHSPVSVLDYRLGQLVKGEQELQSALTRARSEGMEEGLATAERILSSRMYDNAIVAKEVDRLFTSVRAAKEACRLAEQAGKGE